MPILHIRDENGQFVPIPAIKGDDGKDGKDGKSAYEQAKEGGYTGTEEEFVDFLNGLTNSEIATHCSDFDNPHKVTAEQAGAAPEQHNHSADAITSGTFDTGRLPIVPVSKGGTGATNLSDVFVGSAELANHLSMNNCSNIDFNTIKTAGFYSGYEGMTNAAFTNEISVLEVVPYSNDWILQRQTRLTDGVMKYRFYSGVSGWSEWYLIYTSKNPPSQIEVITYKGTNESTNTQFANLGYKPKKIEITAGEQFMDLVADMDYAVNWTYMSSTQGTTRVSANWTENGVTITYSTQSTNYPAMMNSSGYTYRAIIYR